MSTSQAKKIVTKYANTLRKNRIAFENVYLFGSHAKGTAHKDSDIDVAVVVNQIGRGKKFLDKKMRLWDFTLEVDPRIEPLLLDKNDFKRGKASIMADQIKKHGILVE